MVMDVYQEYILVTYRPFDVHIFHVKLFGELTPFSTPDLQVKECFLAVFFFFLVPLDTVLFRDGWACMI